jgi:DNA-binding NarL/FixJ family response regulator
MVRLPVEPRGRCDDTIAALPGTVLIVDDHPSFRAAARALVEGAGYEVVAEAADGAGALDAIARHAPECVLLDVQLPDADGFAVANDIAARDDPPAVVMTSSRSAADFGPLIGNSPIRGFITKEQLSARALSELWG